MSRRRHVLAISLGTALVATLTVGCEEDKKATPQVIFDGRLETGDGPDPCNDIGPLFMVGAFGTPAAAEKSQPIADGAAFGQGTVSVGCSVTAAGSDEFNVSGTVNLSGATGGLFTMNGKFKATGEQTGISATFSSRESGNAYRQEDAQCVVRYTTSYQGIAPGRVWGELTCPNAVNTGAQTACKVIAQFRFENCGQ